MHPGRVLYVEEILNVIFSYLQFQSLGERLPRWEVAALARTCRAFKEPALDILWERLDDLTPLVRCLPEASSVNSIELYTFNRRLQQADWDVILGYTRRIRELPCLVHQCGLTAGCFEQLSNPPSSIVSIFPKLRHLVLLSPSEPLAHFVRQFISPWLMHLHFFDVQDFESVHALGDGCPNVKLLHIAGIEAWADHDMISSLICHWPNLHYVDCQEVVLNVAAVAHLSCLHNLVHLRFKLYNEVVDWIQSYQSGTSILTFTTLRNLCIDVESLELVWRFHYHLRLPAIECLTVIPYVLPTAPDLLSFLAGLEVTCAHDTLRDFRLFLAKCAPNPSDYEFGEDFPPYYITFDHLHLLTVFRNIQAITINLHCSIDLNERDLLCLAASWPHLEEFSLRIGLVEQYWTESSGITPGGFVQLLEKCRSLKSLCFKFKVLGYTEPPQGHPWHGLGMPKDAYFDIQNSPIEKESVQALGVFFHVAPYPDFRLATYWNNPDFLDTETPSKLCKVYHNRWKRVEVLARKLWEEKRGTETPSARLSDVDVF